MERIKSIAYGCGGQTTAEYALVVLVAGLVVGGVAVFVKSGVVGSIFVLIGCGRLYRQV